MGFWVILIFFSDCSVFYHFNQEKVLMRNTKSVINGKAYDASGLGYRINMPILSKLIG